MIWVKRVAIAIGALLAWLALTLLFVSKERVCNAAIDTLAKEKVTLCYEKRTVSLASCRIDFAKVLFMHSPVARVKKFSATPLQITAEGIRLEGMATNAMPSRITKVVYSPLSGELKAEGDFGKLVGRISLAKRRVKILLTPSPLMRRSFRSTLRLFKQKNGKYLYETKF